MISATLKGFLKKSGSIVFGRSPRIHQIPFGPIKGLKIFTSFAHSPRCFFGCHEPWIAKLSQQYINPGDVVYDLGAHVGYMSLLFRSRVGDAGSVHSFEILPSVATNFFQRTMDANGFTNVVIHPVGLANANQSLDLTVCEAQTASVLYQAGADSGKLRIEKCTTTRLDDFIALQGLPIPSLVKMDIEGAEVDCLLGASATISTHRPILIIEFHSLDLLRKGLSILRSFDYNLITQRTTVDEQYVDTLKHFHESVLCIPNKTTG